MKLIRWDQQMNDDESQNLTKDLATLFANRVTNSSLKNQLKKAVTDCDYQWLVSHTLDYTSLSVSDAINARQCLALYQKRDDIDLGINRSLAAISTWFESERLCAETDTIFRKFEQGGFQFRPGVDSVLHATSRKISKILGDCPSICDLHLRFGPGATTTVPRRNASPRVKLGAPLACSGDLTPLLPDLLEELPRLVFSHEELDDASVCAKTVSVQIHDSKLVTVPKTAKTDRSIAIEPSLNVMLQLGIGSFIAEQLKREGIDISDQSRNQMLARSGSINGELATLDLSSASDTISSLFVRHVLPKPWYDLLDAARSRNISIAIPGREVIRWRQSKFCSMGNGFTFPLETLLFYAVASSVTEAVCGREGLKRVSVYGDDIIVPAAAFDLLVECLTCFGFIPNKKKSFNTGPFRESCGKDYVSGIDVRPVYLRSRPTGQALFVLHNFFYRNYDSEACSLILSYLDSDLIITGPDGYGDGHLLGPWIPRPHRRSITAGIKPGGWGGYTFDTYVALGRSLSRAVPGDSVIPHYSIYLKGKDETADRFATRLERYYSLISSFGSSRLMPELRRYAANFSAKVCGYTYRKGRLTSSLPGVRGYKRISVYTFSRW